MQHRDRVKLIDLDRYMESPGQGLELGREGVLHLDVAGNCYFYPDDGMGTQRPSSSPLGWPVHDHQLEVIS